MHCTHLWADRDSSQQRLSFKLDVSKWLYSVTRFVHFINAASSNFVSHPQLGTSPPSINLAHHLLSSSNLTRIDLTVAHTRKKSGEEKGLACQ